MKTPKFLDVGKRYKFYLKVDDDDQRIVGEYLDDLGDGWILVDRPNGPAIALNLACVPQIEFYT
jgi:hypothetical protein